jgi:hypothetical protein
VDRHRPFHSGKTAIINSSYPQPFIGNIETAKVVFLALNPGHSDIDESDHQDDNFKHAMLLNLHQKPQPFPFYALDPQFAKTGAGLWWRARTKELVNEHTGLTWEDLGRKLMVIEWFPYHSKTFSSPKNLLESQRYSFDLAKQAVEMGKLVVRMRSKRQWDAVSEKLKIVPSLKTPRCAYVSERNCGPDLFARIVKALR